MNTYIHGAANVYFNAARPVDHGGVNDWFFRIWANDEDGTAIFEVVVWLEDAETADMFDIVLERSALLKDRGIAVGKVATSIHKAQAVKVKASPNNDVINVNIELAGNSEHSLCFFK